MSGLADRLLPSLRTSGFVLVAGAVTWAWSEAAFWARVRPEDSAASMVGTWLVYALVVYVALWTLRRYRVRQALSLFLVGALLGWLAEGVMVAELYTELPFSISWTALGWHALLTVLGGWWWLPGVLRAGGCAPSGPAR